MRPIRVKSDYVTASSTVTSTRTTLFCVYASGGVSVGGNVNRYWDFRNGASDGDILYRVQRYSNGGHLPIGELELPANGILFPDGIYVGLSWTPLSGAAMTLFYQQ